VSDEVLLLIPARGGFKEIPLKNIANVAGKPLIAWTIEEAVQSPIKGRIVVSTGDPQIADIAQQYGAEIPFLRPAELAQDNLLHCLPALVWVSFGNAA